MPTSAHGIRPTGASGPAQVFIFPGVGFGAVLVKSREVTDSMFASAAQRLADYVSPGKIQAGELYPELGELREISLKARSWPPHCR